MRMVSDSPQFSQCPDGGWGWVIVFASFMIHVIADGVTYTFGIFYVELLHYFGTSKATTAWVASIMTGTTYCVGPIASGLTNKYGCRAVTIVGSLFASFGLLMSIIAPNITYLYFSIGICTGFGFGLMYLPAIVSVTCYFEKKRAFATGIAVCGSGIGSAILAIVIEWLINVYGWKGAMLIISGLVLNCCVCGALFRPLEVNTKCDDEDINNVCTENKNDPLETGNSSIAVESNKMVKIEISPQFEYPDNDWRKSDFINISDFDIERNNSKSPSRHSSSLNKVNDIVNNDNKLDYGSVCFNDAQSNFQSVSLHSVQMSHQSPAFNPLSDRSLTDRSERRSFSLSPGILNRKDIFYSASLLNIPQYRSNPILFNISSKQTKDHTHDWIIFQFFNCSNEVIDTFYEMMDFGLLKNGTFLIFAISNFLTSIGFFVPHIYIKDRAVGLKLGSDEEASFLLSIIGISSTIGRLAFGYISDHAFINRLWLYNGSLTICGLVTIFSSLAKTYWLMAMYCAAFGLSCGAYVSLTSVILVDLLGIEKLTNAFGILLLFQGLASFIGPPIIGWLYDTTGTYDTGFYVAGCMIAISGIMLFFIVFAKYCKSIQRHLIL